MSAAELKEKAPAPLDPFGNEVCLLFLKYGKCRYKKKCKKSHILPDKNAPIMRMITEFVPEQPTVKTGPRVAFSVKKTPYARSTSTTVKPKIQKLRGVSGRPDNGQLQQGSSTVSNGNGMELDMRGVSQTVGPVPSTHFAPTTKEDIQHTALTDQAQPEKTKPKKSKPKHPAKVPSKCLLASLFKTNIPSSGEYPIRRQQPADTFVIGQPQIKEQDRTKGGTKSTFKSRAKSKAKSITPVAASTYSTNISEASSEKIEQWYITNKAHLETVPESMPGGGGNPRRRLMVLNKPTTVRQKAQLKIMRKHHWECRLEIEQQLKRNIPAMFSLKVARTKIDWEKVAPYIALMLQAAFDMDIGHDHLPTIGTTLCIQLEQRDLSAIACEKMLASWGLTELDARRFTYHLWEISTDAERPLPLKYAQKISYRLDRQKQQSRSLARTAATTLATTKTRSSTLLTSTTTRMYRSSGALFIHNKANPAIPGDKTGFLPGDKITGETQIGPYPNLPMYNQQWRDGNDKYWDQQDRRNFGETVPEEDEVLNIWSPDVADYPVSLGVKGLLAAAAAFLGFGYMLSETRPAPHFERRSYPDGLLEALGVDASDEVMVEKRGARVAK
ncbi:hypothetical protein BGX27_010010 [Mortierella sp. AM989]|nr:hypothetical protein BGX27_010010 [Mortierella sp. AM989]